MGKMGKDFCPNFLQPLLENVDRRSCSDGSLCRKGRPSPSAVARTLEYLLEVRSEAATSGRKKKQVRINIHDTREYLECGKQVDP